MPIAEANLRWCIAECGPKRGSLILIDQNPGQLDEARGSPLKRGKLGPHHQIGSQKVLEKRLHHDPGIRRQHVALSAGGEHAPRLRVEVPGVELGQHGPRHRLYVGDAESGEGREDEHADSGRLRDEVVEKSGERREKQQEEEAQGAAGFECD